MIRLVTGAMAVAVVGAVAAAAAALLPACGVALPGLDRCPDQGMGAALERAAALDARNADLMRAVAALEREVAALQCTAALPEPPPALPPLLPPPPLPPAPPVAVLPPPLPVAPAPAPAIDPEAWAQRDVGLLDGCWQLDSDYAVRNDRTGAVTEFRDWTMCFDGSGAGTATMLGTNGVTCAGEVGGAFAADGTLAVTEAANLQCSDDTFIYRRDLTCRLQPDGAASCAVTQPDVGVTSTVRLRRSAEVRP